MTANCRQQLLAGRLFADRVVVWCRMCWAFETDRASGRDDVVMVELCRPRWLNAQVLGPCKNMGPGFCRVCNPSILTGQCGMDWAGHSGSYDLAPGRGWALVSTSERYRGGAGAAGHNRPQASVDFLNSSGPALLRRLSR